MCVHFPLWLCYFFSLLWNKCIYKCKLFEKKRFKVAFLQNFTTILQFNCISAWRRNRRITQYCNFFRSLQSYLKRMQYTFCTEVKIALHLGVSVLIYTHLTRNFSVKWSAKRFHEFRWTILFYGETSTPLVIFLHIFTQNVWCEGVRPIQHTWKEKKNNTKQDFRSLVVGDFFVCRFSCCLT